MPIYNSFQMTPSFSNCSLEEKPLQLHSTLTLVIYQFSLDTQDKVFRYQEIYDLDHSASLKQYHHNH
jgi:hypothetical protein